MKFAEKPKMKVDADPLQVSESNFVEPVDINVVDVVEIEEGQLDKVSEEARGLETAEGLIGQFEGNATDGNTKTSGKPKITEGLRDKFEELEIIEGPKFEVNRTGGRAKFVVKSITTESLRVRFKE